MLTLSGTNSTYSGGTTVTSGTAVFTNAGAFPSFSTTAAKLAVGNSGTITVNVGGSGWTAANVGSLLAANSGSFAAGSTLGIDTTNASGTTTFSFNVLGSLGLTKLGPNTLSLSAANAFGGTTTISGGTLNLANENALQDSTLVAPTSGGTLAFDPSVHAFTLGGLGGAGNLSLQNGAAIALSVGANGTNTVFAGGLSGSGVARQGGQRSRSFSLAPARFPGAPRISGGTLQLGDGTSGHDGVLSASNGISDGASFGLQSLRAQTYAGAISGTGGMTKLGGGILVLTNTTPFPLGRRSAAARCNWATASAARTAHLPLPAAFSTTPRCSITSAAHRPTPARFPAPVHSSRKVRAHWH